MKKLLLSTIVLFAFSLSIIVFQISCKKDAVAQSTTTPTTQLNLIVYYKEISKGLSAEGSGEIWLANLDGSNQRKVSIQLPVGERFPSSPRLSPDGKTIVFTVSTNNTNAVHIYSCSIDGSNLKKLVSGSDAGSYNYERAIIGGVY